MKISECLKKIDKVCEFIPGVSTLVNTVNMITLTILKISKKENLKDSSNPYVRYLGEKGYLGCAVSAVPFAVPGLYGIAFVLGVIEKLKQNASSRSTG